MPFSSDWLHYLIIIKKTNKQKKKKKQSASVEELSADSCSTEIWYF